MKRKYLLLGLFYLFFILYIILICFNKNNKLDSNIMEFIYNIRGNKFGFIYWFFRIITEFGWLYFIVAIIVVLGIIFKFDLRVRILSISLILNYLSNLIIKLIVQRPRPIIDYRWVSESSFSFPSGHSNASFCLYILLIVLFINNITNKKIKYILKVICIFFMIMIPISRVFLGVHFLTDILGGAILGSLNGYVSYNVYKFFIKKREKFSLTKEV